MLESDNQIVTFCGQLTLSGSKLAACKNVNVLWSKYSTCLPKLEKLSYVTMLAYLDRFEKLKYGTYGVYDELSQQARLCHIDVKMTADVMSKLHAYL